MEKKRTPAVTCCLLSPDLVSRRLISKLLGFWTESIVRHNVSEAGSVFEI
jgi:hypothetical protein